jgi:hypothetical protein
MEGTTIQCGHHVSDIREHVLTWRHVAKRVKEYMFNKDAPVFAYAPYSEVIWVLILSIRRMLVVILGPRPLCPLRKIPQYPLNSWLDGP